MTAAVTFHRRASDWESDVVLYRKLHKYNFGSSKFFSPETTDPN